ncbi:MAG: NAD(P)/FAD-dependent oxidoreductase [Planctomycetota bacterium]
MNAAARKRLRVLSWSVRIATAAILFQTLFFKFTGAEESVYIFTTLGMEPWGRIGSGIAELVCCGLLLWPTTVTLGAGLTLAVISGALVSHLTRLGLEVQGDGGLLFALAVGVFLGALGLVWIHRAEIPFFGHRFIDRTGPRPEPKYRVLVLGGGFGGVYTALELERQLEFRDDVRVTLVNRENFFLFTPMLHEVAASDLDLTNIVSPIRKLLARTDFFEGEAVAVDLGKKTARLRHGDGHEHDVAWDQLVLAPGSVTNFFGLPGLEEHALTMKSLADAMQLRNRMIQHLEQADTECACAERAPLLTFVVAGGGFAGVETIGGMNDFLRAALPWYGNLAAADLKLVLVHPGELLLPELGPELGRYAQEKLAERGVDIRTGVRVRGVGPAGVELSDGTTVAARTLVWTAGTSPHPLLATLPAAKERGRLRVEPTLAVSSHPGVWALGDAAAIPDGKGSFHPPTAQHALREARTLARNLLATLDGRPLAPFRFTTLGQLAAIGRRAGVARIAGRNISGFVAWWLWRTIYLAKLPRLEKKLRCMLDWTLDLFFSKDLVQFLGSAASKPAPSALEKAPSARGQAEEAVSRA